MKLFGFWPLLVLLTIPDATVLYWEPQATEYQTEKECSARLPELEKAANADAGFLTMARMLNHGEMPEMKFSRECIDKPPGQYFDKIRSKSPGEST